MKPDSTELGRVPRELAAILSPALRRGDIRRLNAVFTGDLTHDGIDVGGGPKLNVMYFFQTRDDIDIRQNLAAAIHGRGRVASEDMYL